MSQVEEIKPECDKCAVIADLRLTIRRQDKKIDRLERENDRAWTQVRVLTGKLRKYLRRKK